MLQQVRSACPWLAVLILLLATSAVRADVFTDVPEAADYEVLYSLAMPAGPVDFNTAGVPYTIDHSATFTAPVDRVAYYMELKTPTGPREWAYVSMDAISQDTGLLGVPTFDSRALLQQNAVSANVYSNKSGVMTGTGFSTCNLEFWGSRSYAANQVGVPNASDSLYDAGDVAGYYAPGYGSMQIHNHGTAAETIMAYNGWGHPTLVEDIGIGTYTGTNPDWTFAGNAGTYEIANLVVLAKKGTIGLSHPTGHQVIQRGTSGSALVTLEGRFDTTESISTIEARAVARAGYAGTTTDWIAIDSSPTGGAFSSAIRVEGGWYDIEVRALDGATPIGTHAVENVGVGEMFICAGQSNSANWGQVPLQASDSRVSMTNGTTWVPAKDPLPVANGPHPDAPTNSGSPWTPLGDALVDEYDVPVGFLSVGWGGTEVAEWLPGTDHYARLETALKTLGPNGARAVLWHQGEKDNRLDTPTATYADRLETIIATSRTAADGAGYEIPWLVALTSYLASYGVDPAIIAGQQAVIDGDPFVFVGSHTDDLLSGYRFGSHFNAAGLVAHGEQWYDALVASNLLTTAAPGDANKDGTVNELDAQILAENWGEVGATWLMGDFDEDGVVDAADAAILAANWGYSGQSEPAAGVPEPSLAVVLISAATSLFMLRRRIG